MYQVAIQEDDFFDGTTCWVCTNQALPGKQLCEPCLKVVARDSAADTQKVKHYIKSAVKEGLRYVSKVGRYIESGQPLLSQTNQKQRFLRNCLLSMTVMAFCQIWMRVRGIMRLIFL